MTTSQFLFSHSLEQLQRISEACCYRKLINRLGNGWTCQKRKIMSHLKRKMQTFELSIYINGLVYYMVYLAHDAGNSLLYLTVCNCN